MCQNYALDNNLHTFPEEFDPKVLDAFYKDPVKYAYTAQIEFLNARLNRQHKIQKARGLVLEDRTIYEDFHIFGKAQKLLNHLTQEEYSRYEREYHLMLEKINQPDLIVYLKADTPTLLNRISKRGRDSEKSIKNDYIEQLNILYETFINNHTPSPTLIIDAKETDDMEHYVMAICSQIKNKISELYIPIS